MSSSLIRGMVAALALASLSTVVHAQTAATAPAIGAPLISTGNAPLTGVAIGNGIHQSQPVVSTFQGTTPPLIGVGALSGKVGHDGSVASVSVLNSSRLLGVSLGPVGSNGLNVANPTGKPVLSGLAK